MYQSQSCNLSLSSFTPNNRNFNNHLLGDWSVLGTFLGASKTSEQVDKIFLYFLWQEVEGEYVINILILKPVSIVKKTKQANKKYPN